MMFVVIEERADRKRKKKRISVPFFFFFLGGSLFFFFYFSRGFLIVFSRFSVCHNRKKVKRVSHSSNHKCGFIGRTFVTPIRIIIDCHDLLKPTQDILVKLGIKTFTNYWTLDFQITSNKF